MKAVLPTPEVVEGATNTSTPGVECKLADSALEKCQKPQKIPVSIRTFRYKRLARDYEKRKVRKKAYMSQN